MTSQFRREVSLALERFPLLHRVARALYRRVRSAPRSDQDRVRDRIERALSGRSDIFFVEIGANDGVAGDVLHPLIMAHPEWRGLFVEPIRHLFEGLRRNYRSAPRFQFANVAISEQRGTALIYFLPAAVIGARGRGIPAWAQGLGSFDRGHILRELGPEVEPLIQTQEAESIPLGELLDRHGVRRIDLLQIDVEGFDYQVLRQVDFSRYTPAVVRFEHKHLSPDDQTRAWDLLKAAGYQLEIEETDTLACRPD
ncbi:MAG: FkbM family methyltransferase [Candidatus Eisenbacteria bacterium]|nr:FkbM family methyltransferase [Candidatus Eisenbacteria bacterium]